MDSAAPEAVIQTRRRRLANQGEIALFFTRLLAMLLLLWVMFGVVFAIVPVRNDDMYPRLSAGDWMLCYRLADVWNSGDVVAYTAEDSTYIGRIVAQSGDTVELTADARLVINGSTVMESNIYETTPQYESDVTYPVTLGEHQLFLLCDHREGGKDSRMFGAVSLNHVQGKVIAVLRRSGL